MGHILYGAFLLAGLDSSLKVALRAEVADRPVSPLSVVIENDARSNELARARRGTARFGTQHHAVAIGQREFVDHLQPLAWRRDELARVRRAHG